MKVYTRGGTAIELVEPPLAQGGEGAIYRMKGYPERVAKVYLRPEDAAARRPKIEAMASISDRFGSSPELKNVAWPLGALYADKGCRSFVGFGMRYIKSPINIDALYEYPPQPGANFSMADKLQVAESIASVTRAVHEAGQVVGDYNDNNVRVLPGCTVALVDVDSFHVSIGGKTYRCPVCMAGYVAPEVLRNMHGCRSYEECPRETFTEKTDDWALAVHMFRILFNGVHPYHCVGLPDASGSVPAPLPMDKRVERGETPFFKRVRGAKTPPFAPDVDMLPDYLRKLFERAFVAGHTDPAKRPSAAEWEQALHRYRGEVCQTCHNEAHWHAARGECPYCAADERAGLKTKPRKTVVTAPKAAAAVATGTPVATGTASTAAAPAGAPTMSSGHYWAGTLACALLIGLLYAFVTPLCSLALTELLGSCETWLQVLMVIAAFVGTAVYNACSGAKKRRGANCVWAMAWAIGGIAVLTLIACFFSLIVAAIAAVLSSDWFWIVVVIVIFVLVCK